MHPESRRQPAILEPPRSEPSPPLATRVVADPLPTALSHAAWPYAKRTAGPGDGNTDHTQGRRPTRDRHPTAYSSLAKCPRILLEPSPDVEVVAIVRTDVLYGVLRGPEQLPLPQCGVHLGRYRNSPWKKSVR